MEKNEVSKDKNIKLISMHDEMSSSYLSYAMSVIVSRALPDVRDGLKPVHRRILYAMYKGGYDWSKQFRKSARIVGDVIGKYHPHGDQSVYDALVRMVQDFSMSLPLVDGQGNFGSIDGDPAAAMRYTETRLSKVSQFLIDDIEKNTIDFKSNYDETEKEPSVLPAQFPNLLVNGAGGIAVGMATSIPPHNLGEIINGTLALIDNKDIKIKDLMKHIPGPDFPTGGVIIGKDIIKQGYNKGRGSFKIRGGRCEACEGDGVITYEMHFLPDVYIQCDECKGTRYNRETLEIKFKDKSIADVLNMTVDEGCEYFENISNIKTKLLTLKKVGLGYIKIGQQATTLSGGEAQRIKLAKELSKRSTGRTMYILDEPTTGLHQHDIKKLLEILHTFVALGNTVVVIEHNLDVIKTADYIVDMGPEGGVKGGKIIAEGKPEEVCKINESYTGKFLKPLLN